MKIMLAFVLVILVSGCGLTDKGNAFRDYFQNKSQKVSKQMLDNAIWYTCEAASVGSIREKFGSSQESAYFYHNYCLRSINLGANVINPELRAKRR